MSKETEAKFLSKRQTKRNLEKYVQNLLVECNWNQADNSSTSEVLSQPCTSRSITNAQLNLDHLDLNQNFNLNSDVLKLNTQQQRSSTASSSTTSTTELDKSDFSYLVLTKLASLENSMNFLIPTIKQLMAHFRLTNKSHVKNVPQIPVDSDDNLNNLETFLDNKENFEYMINILHLSGGTTIAQITRRTLEKLITNNYATNFNWAGRAPKKALKCLKMKSLVVATVKSVEPNAAINLIENSIKDWLKLASVRATLAESRKLKRNLSVTI